MICPFCSLLCDADDLREIQCERRMASLAQYDSLSLGTSLPKPASIPQLLKSAKQILVTGRIASVETARAAVTFAVKFHATIDCAESGNVFKNILAIQRAGLNSVSLAEARDHTDVFIVVGNDGFQSAVPRLPLALSKSEFRSQTVLLLGDFGSAATEHWRLAGFDTWSVPCDLSAVPSSLAQFSRWLDCLTSDVQLQGSRTNLLFERMRHANYTTVVWSAANIDMAQADLWVERLLQWIASRNETTRCAALPWTSTDGTFQQVCTWLTGFPGRVRFLDGVPSYDPVQNSYEHWMDRTLKGAHEQSIIVLIDETINAQPFVKLQPYHAAATATWLELTPTSTRFPTAVSGLEMNASVFRADQCLLAHVEAERDPRPFVKSAVDWLEELSR